MFLSNNHALFDLWQKENLVNIKNSQNIMAMIVAGKWQKIQESKQR